MEQSTLLELKEIFPFHGEVIIRGVVERNAKNGDCSTLLTRCIDELVTVTSANGSECEEHSCTSPRDGDTSSVHDDVKKQLELIFPHLSPAQLSASVQYQSSINKVSPVSNLLQRCIDDLLEGRVADNPIVLSASDKSTELLMNGGKNDTSSTEPSNTSQTGFKKETISLGSQSHGYETKLIPETVKLNQNNNNVQTSSTKLSSKRETCTVSLSTEIEEESSKTNDCEITGVVENKKVDSLNDYKIQLTPERHTSVRQNMVVENSKANDNKDVFASDRFSSIDISDSDPEESIETSITDNVLDSDDDLPPCNFSIKTRDRTWSPKVRLSKLSTSCSNNPEKRQYISPSKFGTKSESSFVSGERVKTVSVPVDPLYDVFSASKPLVPVTGFPNRCSKQKISLESSNANFKLTPSKLISIGSATVPHDALSDTGSSIVHQNSQTTSEVRPAPGVGTGSLNTDAGGSKSVHKLEKNNNSMFTPTNMFTHTKLPFLGNSTITTDTLLQITATAIKSNAETLRRLTAHDEQLRLKYQNHKAQKPNPSLCSSAGSSVSASASLSSTAVPVSTSAVPSTKAVPIASGSLLSTTASRGLPFSHTPGIRSSAAQPSSSATVSSPFQKQPGPLYGAEKPNVPTLSRSSVSSTPSSMPCKLKPPTIVLGKKELPYRTPILPKKEVSMAAASQGSVNPMTVFTQSTPPILKPATFTIAKKPSEATTSIDTVGVGDRKINQNNTNGTMEKPRLVINQEHLLDVQVTPKQGSSGVQRATNQTAPANREWQHNGNLRNPVPLIIPINSEAGNTNGLYTPLNHKNNGLAIGSCPLPKVVGQDQVQNEPTVNIEANEKRSGNIIDITDDSFDDPDVILDDSFDMDAAEILDGGAIDLDGYAIDFDEVLYDDLISGNRPNFDATGQRALDHRYPPDMFLHHRYRKRRRRHSKKRRHNHQPQPQFEPSVPYVPHLPIPELIAQDMRIPAPPRENTVHRETVVNQTVHNVEEIGNTKSDLLGLFPDIDPEHVDRLCMMHTGPMALNTICNILLESSYPKKPMSRPTPTATATSTSPVVDENVDYFKDYKSVHIADRRKYLQQVGPLLNNEFSWVSAKDIMFIMRRYDYYYAPSFQELSLIWKQALELVKKAQTVMSVPARLNSLEFDAKLSSGSENVLKMKLLKNKRPHRTVSCLVPELIKEIDFVKTKLSELEQEADLEMAKQLNEKEYEDEGQCIECGCCYGEYPFDRMVQCSDGHLFCQDCLKQYAKEAVFGQGKADLRCMTDMCEFSFPKSQLEIALPSEMLAKYEDRVQEDNLNLAELGGLVRCPHCDFQALLDDNNKVFTCLKCNKATCRHCKEDWEEHFGKRCEEVEKKDETKIRLAYEERMTQAKVRTCHRCKSQFMKEDGCNKMTCRCGAKMCYICRKPNIDYNHFCRHARDPGKDCTTCKDCSLWTNPEEDDDRAVREIQKQANDARKQQGYTDDRLIGAPEDPPSKKQKLTRV